MAAIQGFAVQEVEFTKDGPVAKPEQADGVVALVRDEKLTDLVVLSHGWNNDMDQARSLYRDWLKVMRKAVDRQGWTDADHKIGAVAVLWPSKQFAVPDKIPGGAASHGDDADDLVAQVDALDGVLAPEVRETLRNLAPQLDDDEDAREQFVAAVLGVLADTSASDAEAAAEIPSSLFKAGGGLLEKFGDFDEADLLPPDEGGAARHEEISDEEDEGGATGFREFFGGVVAGARNLLNYVTYYKMKDRAGRVGRRGLAVLLGQVRAAHPNIRIHLVGHSFGCRLVTASLLGPEDNVATSVQSMVLLQGAFSHNGFADDYDGNKDGFFRAVFAPNSRVLGPTLITHTKNDKAVGILYPLASRLAGHDSAAFGGPDDKYGALGRNGAIKTPEAFPTQMLPAGKDYDGLKAHQIHNLKADAIIKSHSDVAGDAVGEVIVQAIGAT